MPRIRAAVPDVELVVVGDTREVNVRGLSGPGVSFAGHVPDVTTYYDQASVAVVPLNSGAGTRLKVLEALAHGVPLVSTSFGCRGHDLQPGRDALIADDAESFATACVEVLSDPRLAARLAANGAQRFAGFSSESTTSNVQSVIRQVVDDADPSVRSR
jgi:glycosyltransferase involved in cell wall biosynthesis